MRKIALVLAAASILSPPLALSTSADAQPVKRRTTVQVNPSRAAPSRVETMETIRANALDPAGNYRGYPDWARAAFGPMKQGGGGR